MIAVIVCGHHGQGAYRFLIMLLVVMMSGILLNVQVALLTYYTKK